MTNSLPWKIQPFLRTVNHLFLWAIYTMAMLNNQRGNLRKILQRQDLGIPLRCPMLTAAFEERRFSYSRAKVKTHFLRSIMIFPETDLSENRTIIPVPLNHFEGVPIFWHAKIQIKLGSISHLSLFCLVNTINPYSCCKSQEIPRHLCLGNHSFCLSHVNFSPFLSCDQPSHIGRELVPDITKRRAERSCRNPASLSWYKWKGASNLWDFMVSSRDLLRLWDLNGI